MIPVHDALHAKMDAFLPPPSPATFDQNVAFHPNLP